MPKLIEEHHLSFKEQEHLILKWIKLPGKVASRYSGWLNTDYYDLYQVGCVGLVKAARRWDVVLGGNYFPVFARRFVEYEIQRYLRDKANIVRIPRRVQKEGPNIYFDSLNEKRYFSGEGLTEKIDYLTCEKSIEEYIELPDLERFLGTLTERQKKIFHSYYFENLTYLQTGEKHGYGRGITDREGSIIRKKLREFGQALRQKAVVS